MTTPFEPEEAHALADFLVVVINLESAAKALLAEFYARPERRYEFTEAFLDPLTVGRAVERLHPVLAAVGVSNEEWKAVKKRLDDVIKVRNLVAHWAPGVVFFSDDEGHASALSLWEHKKQSVRVDELETFEVEAVELAGLLRRLGPAQTDDDV